jgi:hypothetical protein
MSDHWKSLADLLGAPGLAATPKPSIEPASESTPAPAAATPVVEHVQPAKPEVKQAEPPVAAEPAKPKKRSSWETLANLFGIESRKEPEPEPTPVAVTPLPAANPEISLFKPADTSPGNPALTEMFGTTSTTPHEQWGKPRKMVDDLGWDEDVPPPPRTSLRSEVSQVREESPIEDEVESEDGTDPVRRSRRRRRRGRGGRDEGSNEVGRRGFDERPVLKDDSEGELEVFREVDDDWDNPPRISSEDVEPVQEDVVSEDTERRPRRRRRPRGRGRGERSGREVAPVERLAEDESDLDSVNRDLLNDYDDEEASPDAIYDELPTDAMPVDEDGVRRRRRRKRNRGGKPERSQSDVPQLEEDDVDEQLEVDSDVDQEAGDEESSAHKHRNIPTWEDSLVSIIEANIENHRRNEGRGGGYRGGGGGGRNRGRK